MTTVLYYSQATGRLRAIYEDDKSLADCLTNLPPQSGALTTEYLIGGVPTIPEAQAAVDAVTGSTPSGDRFAVVLGSTVISVIVADLAIDSVPGHELIASETAGVGNRRLADDTFVLSDAQVDEHVAKLDAILLDLDIPDPIEPPPPAEVNRRKAAIRAEIRDFNALKART